MQLKIQRSQRKSVLGAVVFCLDLRADYTSEERDDIRKYGLGSQVVYSSRAARQHALNASVHFDRVATDRAGGGAKGLARGALSAVMAKLNLNVSIGSLAKGHHIECKDLEEMIAAEEELRFACRDITKYLQVAATFNGSEVVIGHENGAEIVNVTQNAPPLIEYKAETVGAQAALSYDDSGTVPDERQYYPSVGEGIASMWPSVAGRVAAYWADPTNRFVAYALGGIAAFVALLRLIH
jgi:hypothetical protein